MNPAHSPLARNRRARLAALALCCAPALLIAQEPVRAGAAGQAAAADSATALLARGRAFIEAKQYRKAQAALEAGWAWAAQAGAADLAMAHAQARAELALIRKDAPAVAAWLRRAAALQDSLHAAQLDRARAAADSLASEAAARLQAAQEARRHAEAALHEEQAAHAQTRRWRAGAFVALALSAMALLWQAIRFGRRLRAAARPSELPAPASPSTAPPPHPAAPAAPAPLPPPDAATAVACPLDVHLLLAAVAQAAQLTQGGRHIEALAQQQALAKLLRLIAQQGAQPAVALADEMALLRQYLKIEALRAPGLAYAVDAEPALLDAGAQLPPLAVLPFVQRLAARRAASSDKLRLDIGFALAPDGLACTLRLHGSLWPAGALLADEELAALRERAPGSCTVQAGSLTGDETGAWLRLTFPPGSSAATGR